MTQVKLGDRFEIIRGLGQTWTVVGFHFNRILLGDEGSPAVASIDPITYETAAGTSFKRIDPISKLVDQLRFKAGGSLILTTARDNRLKIITVKAIRESLGCGLLQAKQVYEYIQENQSWD